MTTILVTVLAGPGRVMAAPAGLQAADDPFFVSGFKGAALTEHMASLIGIDQSSRHDWANIGGWVDHHRFQYLAHNEHLTDYVNTEVVDGVIGRLGTTTTVLRMTTKADDEDYPAQPAQTRNELSLYPRADFQEGFVRYWAKLPTDLPSRIDQTKVSPWWNFMEWKEPNSGEVWDAKTCDNEGALPGGTNNFRVNVNLRRDAGVNQPFFFHLIGEQVQPCRKQEWAHTNKAVHVPLGSWFLVEAYFKRHPTEGRVYLAVDNQVVLDTAAVRPAGFTTQHRTDPKPLDHWSPFKVYHHPQWWSRGPITVQYDDIRLHATLPSTEGLR